MVPIVTVLFLLVPSKAYHEDIDTARTYLKPTEIIRSYGYPAEQYQGIKTDDDYLLTVHRIPYGKVNRDRENRPVVFMMHGLLCSSVDWVHMGPGVSIAYDLVEAGYDVWLGNARGTKMCRAHKRLHPSLNSNKFWSFSFHEIGYYDLPAMIDFALKRTKQAKLSYIGHSQGTTAFFVMLCTKPVYNKKIKFMVALAPMVYTKHSWNPFFQLLSQCYNSVRYIATLIGSFEFTPCEKLYKMIGLKFCQNTAMVRSMCENPLFLIGGWDSEQLNKSAIPLIVAHAPAGASCLQLKHYAQCVETGKFRQYDYGEYRNFVKYRDTVPPTYDLKKVKCPVTLIYAENDWLSAPSDVERLKSKLPNVVKTYKVPHQKFNHLDFLYASNLKEVVNDHVLSMLDEYDV